MPELEKLYKILSSDKTYDTGDQSYFMEKYSSEENLQKLYGVLSKDSKYDVGTWDYFSNKYGVKKKEPVQSPAESFLDISEGWAEKQNQSLTEPSESEGEDPFKTLLSTEAGLPDVAVASSTYVSKPVIEPFDPSFVTPPKKVPSLDQRVMISVEDYYTDKDWKSPKSKLEEYRIISADLNAKYEAGEITEDELGSGVNKAMDDLNLIRKGDRIYVPETEIAMYKDLVDKEYRKEIQSLPEKEKEPFIKDVVDALNVGSARVLQTPFDVLAISEKAGNAILNLVGMDKNTNEFFQERQKTEKVMIDSWSQANQRYDQGITDAIADGKVGEAIGQTVLQTAETLPQLTALILGNAAGATNATLGLLGVNKAADSYLRSESDTDMNELTKIVNALGKGLSEVVFENIGTVSILNSVKEVAKKEGEDVLRDQLVKGFTPYFQRKIGVLGRGMNASIRESASEMATQLTDNIMDAASGKDVMIGEGVVDSGIIGLVVGGGLVAPSVIQSGRIHPYVKQLNDYIPKDLKFEERVRVAELLVEGDYVADQIESAPKSGKSALKKKLNNIESEIDQITNKETPVEVPEKPVEALSPESEGKVPPEGEKPLEATKQEVTPKTETDAIPERSTKKVDVETQAQDGKKVGEGDTKAQEEILAEESEVEGPPEPPDITGVQEVPGKNPKEIRKNAKAEKLKVKDKMREIALDRRSNISVSNLRMNRVAEQMNKTFTNDELVAMTYLREGVGVPEKYKGTDVERLYENPSVVMKKNLKEVDRYFNEMWEEIVGNNESLSGNQIENYLTHIWDIPKNKTKDVVTWFRTRNQFLNKRYIATLKEGMDKFGLAPRFERISDIMKVHHSVSRQAIENKKYIDTIKETDVDGVPLVATEKNAPAGYIPYDHPALNYKVKMPAKSGEGDIIVDRVRYVHPDIAKQLDAILGSSKINDRTIEGIARAWEKLGGIMKKINLSLSLFHHAALVETGLATVGPVKLGKSVGKVIWQGAKGNKPAMAEPELAEAAAKAGVQLGATADIPVQEIQRMVDKLAASTSKIPILNKATKGLSKFNRKWDAALWDYLHDGLKIHAYTELSSKIKTEGKTDKQIKQEQQEIAQLINDTFGGQNWDVLGVSPMAQRVMRWSLLSPDWTISTIRQALAPTGVGRLYKSPKFWKMGAENPGSARIKNGAKFWLRAALYYGVGMNALNALYRLKDMEDNEEFYTDEQLQILRDYKDGDKKALAKMNMFKNSIGHQTHLFVGRDDEGREIYRRWGKQFRELPELLADEDGMSFPGPAFKKIGGKAAPQAQVVAQLFTGKTLSGYENWDMKDRKGWEKTVGIMKMLGKSVLPYSSANIWRDDKQWKVADLVFPASKGMSAYQAVELFENAINARDIAYAREVYRSAVNNGLPAHELEAHALTNHKRDMTTEYKAGLKNIDDIKNAIAETDDLRKKEKLIDELVKMQEKSIKLKEAILLEESAILDMETYIRQYNKKWEYDPSLLSEENKQDNEND